MRGGVNDPIVGPAPAGYTARNAEVSTIFTLREQDSLRTKDIRWQLK